MRLAVTNLVGLSRSLLGPHMPGLTKFAAENGVQTYMQAFPPGEIGVGRKKGHGSPT